MKTLKFLICIYCSLFFFSCSDSGGNGGSGTESNPYRIRYAEQLRYCLEQDKGFYRLENDIDLQNKEWSIKEFNGTLDGNGHTIYNLRIENGVDNPCGLISQLYGTVKNLNLHGVYIKSDGDYVGAIAGKLAKNALIDNCSVSLAQGSLIQGGAYVGGVAGGASGQIFDSKVETVDNSAKICGENYVGGIAGQAAELYGCNVNCDVVGTKYIGGIVGYCVSDTKSIENSSYKGCLKGYNYVGGIAGYLSSYNSSIVACKAVVNIESDNYMGGICGSLNSGRIISCYSDGSINNIEANYAGGIAGYASSNYIYLSYSAIKCGKLANANVTDCYSVYTCDNVTEKMREAYSDYAEYWNFNNQWVWIGELNGVGRMIQCPRLAWEESGATQTGSIVGVVTDADTGKPIKGVKVTMSPLDYVAVTDVNGLYMFEDIKSDRIYSIEFAKSGYKSLVNNVNVVAGKVTDVNVTMTMLGDEPVVWNGEIASFISEGRGTIYDPYLIRTGGELLYAMKQGKGYLKIVNNIDLNNHNWKPYSFSGTLDGDGFTISNLRVERNDETYNGLIGYLTGTVKNIVLEGVYIKTTQNNVGAVAGYMSSDAGTRISNCHITLKKGSLIEGNKNVGGVVGYANKSGVADCSVKSTDAGVVISGSSYVGGIVAYAEATISDCKVDCNIVGTQYVGGIVGAKGSSNKVDTIERCEFSGNINGTENVGGIAGYMSSYNTSIVACRANAVLDGNKYIGGVCGSLNSGKIIACYNEGRINSVPGNTYIGALAGYGGSGDIYLSYSTIECEKLNSAAVTDCYSVYTCDNVTEALRESYSDYASYWNFNNEWEWNGVVDGVNKSVKCPRLSWQ